MIKKRGKMINQTKLEGLKETIRGQIIQPGDNSYDETREVYNGMIDKKPSLIVQCADVADIMASVNFGRDSGLLISVRGGGHSGPGFGVCDDGLVIDLSSINYTKVDPEERTVRVGGGTTWGDVDHATHAFGFATPSGVVSTTGVGGLTLGGGLGYLTRKCGLAIDNLLSADMVLADGSFVKANDETNQDLYWAIRGGGGNFGIITEFKFRLHEIHTIVGGPTLYPIEQGEEVNEMVPGNHC